MWMGEGEGNWERKRKSDWKGSRVGTTELDMYITCGKVGQVVEDVEGREHGTHGMGDSDGNGSGDRHREIGCRCF